MRTSYPLTTQDQQRFFQNLNPSVHRYWLIYNGKKLVGMGGITNIQWENRLGEISLIISPKYRNQGIGEESVRLLLDDAFNQIGLKTVFGECYQCNESGCKFWSKIAEQYLGYSTMLPNRKFRDGQFYDSNYFSLDVAGFNLPAVTADREACCHSRQGSND